MPNTQLLRNIKPILLSIVLGSSISQSDARSTPKKQKPHMRQSAPNRQYAISSADILDRFINLITHAKSGHTSEFPREVLEKAFQILAIDIENPEEKNKSDTFSRYGNSGYTNDGWYFSFVFRDSKHFKDLILNFSPKDKDYEHMACPMDYMKFAEKMKSHGFKEDMIYDKPYVPNWNNQNSLGIWMHSEFSNSNNNIRFDVSPLRTPPTVKLKQSACIETISVSLE